jgi:hypothetical protein
MTMRFRTHQHDSCDFPLVELSVTIRFSATYARVFFVTKNDSCQGTGARRINLGVRGTKPFTSNKLDRSVLHPPAYTTCPQP